MYQLLFAVFLSYDKVSGGGGGAGIFEKQSSINKLIVRYQTLVCMLCLWTVEADEGLDSRQVLASQTSDDHSLQ